MAYRDDTKNAVATLKLAEAHRRTLALVNGFLSFDGADEDEARAIRDLIDSAEQDTRSVDNGKLRDFVVGSVDD